MTDLSVQEHIRVARIDEIDQEKHHHGKRAQNPSRHPALRGMRPDLSLDAQPFAYDARRAVEYFGQVPACFFLHQYACNQHLEILRWHAVQHLGQGIA